jgi:hexosaminidase
MLFCFSKAVFALNPSNPLLFDLINEVLKQIADIFPTRYLHIGGDEVDIECWKEDPTMV